MASAAWNMVLAVTGETVPTEDGPVVEAGGKSGDGSAMEVDGGETVGASQGTVLTEVDDAESGAGSKDGDGDGTGGAMVVDREEGNASGEAASVSAIAKEFGAAVPDTLPAGMCPHMLRLWQRESADPDVAVPRWAEEGAPLGISRDIERCGIFPPVYESAPVDAETSRRATFDWGNYQSAEDSPQVSVAASALPTPFPIEDSDGL